MCIRDRIFGPDGRLYIVIGDLNRDGQLQNFSGGPSPDNTSVIFRIDDDGGAPNDNPFASQPGLAKYYAYGIRNSFGLAFDPVTGDLWAVSYTHLRAHETPEHL